MSFFICYFLIYLLNLFWQASKGTEQRCKHRFILDTHAWLCSRFEIASSQMSDGTCDVIFFGIVEANSAKRNKVEPQHVPLLQTGSEVYLLYNINIQIIDKKGWKYIDHITVTLCCM